MQQHLNAKVDKLKGFKTNIAKIQEERVNIKETIHATVHTVGKLQLKIIADEDFSHDRLWHTPRVRQYWQRLLYLIIFESYFIGHCTKYWSFINC